MEGFAEIKLSYQRKQNKRVQITTAGSACDFFRKLFPDLELREYMYVIMFNNNREVIGYSQISSGGMDFTFTDKRLLFSTILKTPTTCIMLAHNHPSGVLRPSDEDLRLTTCLKEACQLLDIELTDHLIITRSGYFSFADNGKL